MERIFDGKYHWNEEFCEYEMAGKVQEYKGVKIVSIRTRSRFSNGINPNGRHYEVTWPDGHTSIWGMKKWHGLKELKEYIDWKVKHNEL